MGKFEKKNIWYEIIGVLVGYLSDNKDVVLIKGYKIEVSGL